VILFDTLWKNPADGWCIASRAYARCMHMAGLDVRLHDWRDRSSNDLDPEVEREVGHLRVPTRTWDVHIFSSTLGCAKDMEPALLNVAYQPGASAFYNMFERRYVEPKLVHTLNKFSGVWVPCEMNKLVLEQAGAERVTWIPFPHFDDDPHLVLPAPRESRHFYAITRFEPRKDPANIIRAFMRAFRPEEAELTMKMSPIPHTASYYPSAEAVILDELGRGENGWTARNWQRSIHLVYGRLNTREMVELHARGDVYVSASRGEGIDLPIYAAKLAGRRIVTPPSGGPEDFLDPKVDIIVPRTGLIPADPCFKWGDGATLIDYKLDDLIKAMRKAREEPGRGTRTWPGMHTFRADSVAKALKSWIGKVLSARRDQLMQQVTV
jgi:glycosyltransferase involved in cell wall biosynthesis